MKLQTIRVSEIVHSKTNPKGRLEGDSFRDLVASIKEKGVLVPVLVRGTEKGNYEVIAGNRRVAAAKEAGVESIPAHIAEMTDVEAQEAQIVENLQRLDVHPLDEGELYRKLIEKSSPRYTTADVAIKVGKTETYVRQRLALTNLTAKAAKSLRDGKISLSHAILIARLENDKQQNDAVNEAETGSDVADLREWIQQRVYSDASNKPWAKNAKLAEMVGDTGVKEENLFGDKGAGTDPVSYATQMAAYIEIMCRKAKEKGEELVKISTHWGMPDIKGALGRDQYRLVERGDKAANVQKAIVVEGDNLGRIVKITTDKEEVSGSTIYKPTPEERAKRKKELEKERKQKAARAQAFQDAVAKVKLPLSEKHVSALYEFALNSKGSSVQQPTALLLGLEPIKVKEKYGWSSDDKDKFRMVSDWEKTLRKYADEHGTIGKIRVVFALLMSHPDQHYMDVFNRDAKRL